MTQYFESKDPLVHQYDDPVSCKTDPNQPECAKIQAERVFDKAVYGGISYAAQAGTGIVLTDWIKNGAGKHVFQKMAEAFTGKTGEAATKNASSFIIVSTMIMVGNAFLLPVKWLEDRKPQVVRRINEWMNKRREAKGDHVSAEERADQETRLAQLEQEPKQTWRSLGLARAFSLGTVYAVERGIGGPRNEAMSNVMVKGVQTGLNSVGATQLAQSTKLKNLTGIAFYDLFYSMVSAGGLYAYSHFVCPPKDKDKISAVEESPKNDAHELHENHAQLSPQDSGSKWQSQVGTKELHVIPSESHREQLARRDQNAPTEIAV